MYCLWHKAFHANFNGSNSLLISVFISMCNSFCGYLFLCLCICVFVYLLIYLTSPTGLVVGSVEAAGYCQALQSRPFLPSVECNHVPLDSQGLPRHPPWSLWTPKKSPLTLWDTLDFPQGPPSVPYDPLWPPRRPPFLKAFHLDIWIKTKYQLEDLPRPFGLVSPDPRMLFLHSWLPLCTGQSSEGWQQVRVFFNPKRARIEPLESFCLK